MKKLLTLLGLAVVMQHAAFAQEYMTSDKKFRIISTGNCTRVKLSNYANGYSSLLDNYRALMDPLVMQGVDTVQSQLDGRFETWGPNVGDYEQTGGESNSLFLFACYGRGDVTVSGMEGAPLEKSCGLNGCNMSSAFDNDYSNLQYKPRNKDGASLMLFGRQKPMPIVAATCVPWNSEDKIETSAQQVYQARNLDSRIVFSDYFNTEKSVSGQLRCWYPKEPINAPGGDFPDFIQLTGGVFPIGSTEPRNKIIVAPIQINKDKVTKGCNYGVFTSTGASSGTFDPWNGGKNDTLVEYLNSPSKPTVGLSLGGNLFDPKNLTPFSKTSSGKYICSADEIFSYLTTVNSKVKLSQIDFNPEQQDTFADGNAWEIIGATIDKLKNNSATKNIKISITIPQHSNWDIAVNGYANPKFATFIKDYNDKINYYGIMAMNYNTQDKGLKAFESASSEALNKTTTSFNKFLNNQDVKNKTYIILDAGGSDDYGTLGAGKPGKNAPDNIFNLTHLRKFYQDLGYKDVALWLTSGGVASEDLNYTSSLAIAK